MCGRHLEKITTAKHSIELTRDTYCPVYSAVYRDGPTTMKFAAMEINGMLQIEVIEPEMTKWATSIVFTPKKENQLRSASTMSN